MLPLEFSRKQQKQDEVFGNVTMPENHIHRVRQLLLFPSFDICTKTHCDYPKRQGKFIGIFFYLTMAARKEGPCEFCTLLLLKARKALGAAYKKGTYPDQIWPLLLLYQA
ncbi:hypothetical protein TorRG33x02_243920, partial [Trema orientale]